MLFIKLIKNILSFFKERPILCLGIFSFLYTMLVGIFIQFIFLPYISPGMHAGNGLMVGGDWIKFHAIATEQVSKITNYGWSSWELRPQGHTPAGIASVFYYVFTEKPWVLLPLNSSLHALSTVLLASIIYLFTNKKYVAIFASLPFLLFPSASAWYAQIHKDGIYIAGFYLFIYGLVKLPLISTQKYIIELFSSFVLIISGILFVWLSRDYLVPLTALLGLPFFLIYLYKFKPNKSVYKYISFVFIAVILFVSYNYTNNKHIQWAKNDVESPSPAKGLNLENNIIWHEYEWKKNNFLPENINVYLFSAAVLRYGYLNTYKTAASNIDTHIRFTSTTDLIVYIPRALQIGFFSPFPNVWADKSSQSGNLMRRISAVEMVLVYFSLMFLPLFIYKYKRNINIWFVIIACASLITLHAYIVPNVGALYRLRYGYLMLIVAMGCAALLETLIRFREKSI